MANLRPGARSKAQLTSKPEVSSWLPSLGLVPTTSLTRFTIQGPALIFWRITDIISLVLLRVQKRCNIRTATNTPRNTYRTECCAWCKGAGRIADNSCPACKGNGKVRVYQPSLSCPECAGTGRAQNASDSRIYPRCSVCSGSGWARVTMVKSC